MTLLYQKNKVNAMGFCPQLNMTLNKNYNSKKEARSRAPFALLIVPVRLIRQKGQSYPR